jgi:hypothetical protein
MKCLMQLREEKKKFLELISKELLYKMLNI